MLMMQPYQQSSQGSGEELPKSHSKQLLHHGVKNVLRITTDERVSFSNGMNTMAIPISMNYVRDCHIDRNISMSTVTTL